jgi:hypothetical protein
MKEIRFKFNKWSLWIIWTVAFIMGAVPALFTLSLAIISLSTGRTFGKPPSWGTIFLLWLILGTETVLFLWAFIKLLSLRFTEEGIRQRILSGWRFIAWKEITHMRFDRHRRLHLYKGRQKIIVPNLSVCTNREEVADFVRRHLAASQLTEIVWPARSGYVRNGL